MDFKKKTSFGKSSTLIRILIKLLFLFTAFFILVFLFDKINFPHPIKKIEKVISDETFKVIK